METTNLQKMTFFRYSSYRNDYDQLDQLGAAAKAELVLNMRFDNIDTSKFWVESKIYEYKLLKVITNPEFEKLSLSSVQDKCDLKILSIEGQELMKIADYAKGQNINEDHLLPGLYIKQESNMYWP